MRAASTTCCARRTATELYPGDREDDIDFCLPQHESRLLEGWYDLEGVFGNKFRWIGPRATARLKRMRPGPQRLRIRGHAHRNSFAQGRPVRIEVTANGIKAGELELERAGLFIFEADLPDADEYVIAVAASPSWEAPPGRPGVHGQLEPDAPGAPGVRHKSSSLLSSAVRDTLRN